MQMILNWKNLADETKYLKIMTQNRTCTFETKIK